MIIHKPLLLFVSCLFVHTAQSSSQFYVRSHLKDNRNQPRLSKPQVVDLLQKEVSLVLQQETFSISNIQLHRRPAHQFQHVDFDVYIDVETGPQTSNLLRSMENVQAMIVTEIDIESTGAPPTPTLKTPACQNGGFLDNGTCICSQDWEGELCDYLYCFNYGLYDVDEPYQCNCPPGFNDNQCLNRNCRPPIIDDINPPARTLILVLPSIIAFESKRKTILANFAETVNKLQSQEPGWIGYYVGLNFLTDKFGGMYYDTIQTANLTDFIYQMVSFPSLDYSRQEATWDQDLISAIDLAYFSPFAGNPMGNALILAFTDTANYYDIYAEYTGWNDLYERLIIWRAKVFFFVIDDLSVGNRTIDTSWNGYDNIRYYSEHIHAPLFHFSESELPMVMSSVASKLYRTQNVDVRLLTNEVSFDMLTIMDYRFFDTNNTIKVTITLDLLKDQVGSVFLNIGNQTVQPISLGKYWKIYELAPTTRSVTITKSGSDFGYSVFQWLSSEDSFLWGIHETPNIDIGGIYTVPEKENHIGVSPIGTQNVPFLLSYTGRDASTGQFIETATINYMRLVRVATSLKLYFGFTSDMLEDNNVQYSPSSWVRANASTFGETILLGHVSGLKNNETINTFSVTITQGPLGDLVFNANYAPLTLINMIPRLACGYQYYGKVYSNFLREIIYDGLRFKTVVTTSTGSVYTRIVYYYIPTELATTDTCNGAPVNQFGECVCGANRTGEYCENLVCQNSGYSNWGACNCGDDTSGMFCETLIQENVADLTTPTPITTTNAHSTSTQTSKIPTTTVPPIHTKITTMATQKPATIAKLTTSVPVVTSTLPTPPVVSTEQAKTNPPPVSSSASTRQLPSTTTAAPLPATTTKGKGALLFTNTLVFTLVVMLFN